MNKLQLLQEVDKSLDIKYEIQVSSKELVGEIGTSEIVYSEYIPNELVEDNIAAEFEPTLSNADKLDYELAAACGLLTGALSVLWGKKFSLDEAHKWGNEKADSLVKAFAKSQGYKKDDLEGAIEFLERKFPMAGDALTNEFGGGKQHHLRDFSHHPTILGLVCSIGMQFTGTGLGTDTQGNLIHVKITKDGFIGGTFSEKILFGTINWIGHLVSDFDGSSESVLNGTGRGTGIPGPLLATIKELSSLPIFKKKNSDNINQPKIFSEWVSKLFNGTLIKDEAGNPIPFDLRTEMGIGHYVADQAKPVIINECLVRACYMVRRFIDEVKEKDISSLKDLNKLQPRNFIPFNSRSLTRMITVSSGTFVVINTSGTAVKAAIKSKGNKAVFCKEFFLTVNYVGIGRLVFACASDAEYIKDDVKAAYDKYMKEKAELEKNRFKFGYKFLTLNDKQTRLLYSLKSLSVQYDIEHEKNAKHKLIKEEWYKRWQVATKKSFDIDDDDYFMSEEKAFGEIYLTDAETDNKGWLYLLTLELVLFQAYYPLTDNDKDLFKGLKYSNKYLYDVFAKGQKMIEKVMIDDIAKTYNSYVSKLKETGKKVAIGAVATVGATALTGGLALAFAPEIAVVLAGEAVAGLSGAAATNAALATIGGGALAAGGLGMAGGTAILTGGGAMLGLAGASSTSLFCSYV
ncbi:MAG: hypothetical protein K6G87_09385 [Butyrivibrio sp.]|uniref:hypothetical protein n=1 Tax=Butyrivibrio sp. TaxID=28121 RepID=UPI0025DB1E65|nr:hypothetical protein [Butyrivibrio sp.]MCR5771429.1 hypothetical protein [Butyrivibrio sp.]